jgi:hypothetical protein
MPDTSIVIAVDRPDEMFMGKFRIKDVKVDRSAGNMWFDDQDLPWQKDSESARRD